MIALIICMVAFVSVYIAGRRSLSAGVGLALGFGYMYGLIRANYPQPAAYFIFDSSLVGLYLATLTRKRSPLEQRKIIPMIHEPELTGEARAVYELWTTKADKVQF